MKIYLASSWRNSHYYNMLDRLKAIGYEVYNFRDSNSSFSWKQVDPEGAMATNKRYLENINNELCEKAFANDMGALAECDVCVMLMPCGNSAHIEAGYAVGASKPVAIFLGDDDSLRPDLMWKMADLVTDEQVKLESWLAFYERKLFSSAGDSMIMTGAR